MERRGRESRPPRRGDHRGVWSPQARPTPLARGIHPMRGRVFALSQTVDRRCADGLAAGRCTRAPTGRTAWRQLRPRVRGLEVSRAWPPIPPGGCVVFQAARKRRFAVILLRRFVRGLLCSTQERDGILQEADRDMGPCTEPIDSVLQNFQHSLDAIAFTLESIVRHGKLLTSCSTAGDCNERAERCGHAPSARGRRFLLSRLNAGSERFSAVGEFLASRRSSRARALTPKLAPRVLRLDVEHRGA